MDTKMIVILVNKTFANAWLITALCLSSNGHWYDAFLALGMGIYMSWT